MSLPGSRRATLRQMSPAVPSTSDPPRSSGAGREPGKPLVDRLAEVPARRLLERKQRHRRHGVLVDGVDGVALDHLAGPPVVVPPPLPGRALASADQLGAASGRPRARAGGPSPVVEGERLDRVHHVREAGHVTAKAVLPPPRTCGNTDPAASDTTSRDARSSRNPASEGCGARQSAASDQATSTVGGAPASGRSCRSRVVAASRSPWPGGAARPERERDVAEVGDFGRRPRSGARTAHVR